jgi:hypothetical protein
MKPVDYSTIPYDDNERNAFKFRERRHQEWTDNYELYRNKVITNRLTQRQAVNIPLMKETLKTILANTDEFPAIEFEELGNDKDKEILFNEVWKDYVIQDKLELKDIVDKKQEYLYGRTWRKLNIRNGRVETEIKEVFDMLVDRYVDPTDLETAHYIIESGIFQSLDDLESNPLVDKVALDRLRIYYSATTMGLQRAEEVTKLMFARNQRLIDMGVPDMNMPMLGQTMVELKVHYVKIYDEDDKEDHIHVIVRSVGALGGPPGGDISSGSEVLYGKPLKEILGVDFYPFVTWADDPERNDFFSDGVADIVRIPNQVLNVWFSQLVENRTLRNFGMHFFDSTASENWSPQGWTPEPWGFYPLPGKPEDILKSVEIPDLSESLDEVMFVKQLVQGATAATAVKAGQSDKGEQTLGEVQLTTAAANERITSISKFYMLAQREFGWKWAQLMIANADNLDEVKIYKKSFKGNYFQKTVKPTHWTSADGYTCRVVSSAEREQDDIKTLQKFQAVAAQFQGNPAMTRIYQEKMLDFLGLTPDQQSEVMNAAKQAQGGAMAPAQPGAPAAQPALPPPQGAPAAQPNLHPELANAAKLKSLISQVAT